MAQERPTVGARAASVAGRVLRLLARLVRYVTSAIVLLIMGAILLRLLGANPSNSIVSHVHRWASDLVGPFRSLFSVRGAKLALAVNWGIAAIVYSLVGGFLARAISAVAPRRRRAGRVYE